jgi:hypothetical protein
MKTATGIALLCLTLVPRLPAASTTVWEMSTYQDFVKGRFEGISLGLDGKLQLSPKLDTLFASEQPAIWSVAQAPDGTLYAATGHRGRLFRVDARGKSSLLWTAEQPEIFAVTLDAKGVVYAATSPDGKIFRIEDGKAAEYFDPKARYIWSLAFGADGVLYAGTGDQGKIFRVTAAGQGEVYYDTGQAQVTCLAFDREGRLIAGSEPNGIIYQISAKDHAFVLYDSTLPEIRSIVPAPDGSLYAAALGGSIAKRTSGTGQPATSGQGGAAPATTTTTITVSDVNAQSGLDVKPKPEAAKPAQPAPAPATPAYSPVVDLTGVEKSALYKIHTDNTVETLWSSKEENVYDLLANKGNLVFSTDAQGRIYRLSPDRQTTLLWQTNEGQATQLLEYRGTLLAATGEMGTLLVAGTTSEPKGSYTSPVHDAGSVAKWGRLTWHGTANGRGRVDFRTRSGNSARPDRTWSDWSAPIADPANALVRSPNARYIQWRAEMQGAAEQEPVLESVTLAYLPQNTPPVVKSVNVISQQSAAQAQKTPGQSSATAVYSITVTDTGEAGASTASGTPTQNVTRSTSDQLQISWTAEDQDGDRLAYSVYFRGHDEAEWKALRTGIPETSLTLDGDALADGRYLFRVVASDRPSNAGDTFRDGELISSPTLIDHTPPVVTLSNPVRNGQQVEITIDAVDATSDLRRCEASRNARPWFPVEAADGVTDSPRERFLLRLDNVPASEQLIVVRVYDAAGNAGLAKMVLK